MPKKPEKTRAAPPKPELTYEIEGAPPKLFVVRHRPSGTWWGPEGAGYFGQLTRAGTYTEEQLQACNLRPDEDEAIELAIAARDFVSGANPTVLQAMFALGSR